MNRKCRVSLCLIVRDESRNITACLQPLVPLVDEVIVVDTGSTDDTCTLASNLGAKVFHHPWNDSFAAARNHTLEHASGDYILWVDADDRFDAENLSELTTVLKSLQCSQTVYMMDVISRQATPIAHTESYTRHARLFPRLPQIRWEYRVHEQIVPSLQRNGCYLEFTSIKIRHLGYEDATRLAAKSARDLRLALRDAVDHPTDPVVQYNVAHGYVRQGNIDHSLLHYFQCLKYVKKCQDWVAVVFCEVVTLLLHLGRVEDAHGIATSGLSNFPQCRDLLNVRGQVLLALGDIGGAERDFRAAIAAQSGESVAAVASPAHSKREARVNLAHVLGLQRRFADAESLLQRVIAEEALSETAWIGLGELYIRWGKHASAEFVIGQVHKLSRGKTLANCLRSELWRSQGEHLAAVKLMQSVVIDSPELEWPWMELARSSFDALRDDNCKEACDQMLKMNPGDAFAREMLNALRYRSEAFLASSFFTTNHPSVM
jgi:glycosyltransferase involved in cell wall biosynthesis/Flp pilus assembly protein TadD